MPGIVGILKKKNKALDTEQLLSRMCQVIKHEDWYKIDTFLDESIGIGRVSLGILNPESQPIYSTRRKISVL